MKLLEFKSKVATVFLSVFLIFSCSKDDSSSSANTDQGGSINVTGDVKVEGDKIITSAEFEYDESDHYDEVALSLTIFGDDDVGGGFSLTLRSPRSIPKGDVIPEGSYPISIIGEGEFYGTYVDDVENTDGTYTFEHFSTDDGEITITRSTPDLLQARFNFTAYSDDKSKSVQVRGNFTAHEEVW